jgi:hypothetical protein
VIFALTNCKTVHFFDCDDGFKIASFEIMLALAQLDDYLLALVLNSLHFLPCWIQIQFQACVHCQITIRDPAGREPKNHLHFSICACHPCAGAMLIFSVSFQF